MKNKRKLLLIAWAVLFIAAVWEGRMEEKRMETSARAEEQMTETIQEEENKKTESLQTQGNQLSEDESRTELSENLYSLSAVLMDGKTGRVLYEKEGDVKRPMASTTKVMTCILALEHARGDEIVEVSAKAAAQPDVQLNMIEGEAFYMEDLLYSLMLKSHNDTAVAIAEHIGGSVEKFAEMMNEKAKELGCQDTHFVTPNGLDAKDAGGVHATTARDLAKIMSYAVQNETFLKITQTREYSFWDLEKNRQFQVTNANAFLDMMDGVLSGKTGYTADAGYCYVCALEDKGRVYVVSLLGCGWPNHKTYKWSDAKALLEYGMNQYENRSIWEEPRLVPMKVENAVPPEGRLTGENAVPLICEHQTEAEEIQVLLSNEENVEVKYRLPEALEAPVKEGEQVGEIQYYLDGKVIYQFPVVTGDSLERLDFSWCMDQIFRRFFCED